MNLFLQKKKDKREYYQSTFAQFEKDRVKRKWKEKMNQLKKHILFFDFLENYYVSKDEVSQNHLNVIKKNQILLKKIKPLLGLAIHPLKHFL